VMFRKLRAHAPFRRRALARPGTMEASRLDCGGSARKGGRESAAGRLAADIATPGRAIELVDDIGAAVLVSLLGEPHIALRQFRPLRPQHRALFPGGTGAQMGREGAVSVGGAHRLVLWWRLLNLCLSTHDREPSRSSSVPLFKKDSQFFDRLFSDMVQSRFRRSRRQGAR
jgi:hypothetical protein